MEMSSSPFGRSCQIHMTKDRRAAEGISHFLKATELPSFSELATLQQGESFHDHAVTLTSSSSNVRCVVFFGRDRLILDILVLRHWKRVRNQIADHLLTAGGTAQPSLASLYKEERGEQRLS